MINIEEFYLDVNSIHSKQEAAQELLHTPLLEYNTVLHPSLLLALNEYYEGKFEKAYSIASELGRMVDQDASLKNIAGCALYAMHRYNDAQFFFDRACEIIQSYHAIYHFTGYVAYYNRATLHYIMGNIESMNKDLSQAQFLYHENNPNRDIPITIDSEKVHFKNPVKDMVAPQNTISYLSVFNGSRVEEMFWESLRFFEKRQWKKALNVCSKLIDYITVVHKEYHYTAACIFYNRGMNAMELSKYDIAISDFSKAIMFDLRNPNNSVYRQALFQAKKFIESA